MKITYLILFLFGCFIFMNSSAQSGVITVDSKRNTDQSISFSFQKEKCGTYFLSVWFTQLDNAHFNSFNRDVTETGGELFTVKPSIENQGISYRYNYWYIRGKLKPRFDPDFLYFLPTGLNKKVSVYTMTNLGEQYFGSTKPKNWIAYQFIVLEGDTIFAARKGIVVEIKGDNDYRTDTEVSYQSAANFVLVEHEDGTLAKYEGLDKSGILIEEGQGVYPGTPLGTIAKYDIKEQGQLRFSLFYLDFVNPEEEVGKTMKDRVNHYAFIDPVFMTKDGNCRLKSGGSYEADVNDELFTKEFTKKEMKKFRKRQNIE
ncbi:MAG: M23 family metallopeptidase [Draconibacterium sp.]